MKLVGRIPVEPLDDQRLTSIERRIVTGVAAQAAPGRAPRRWGGLAFAAALAVIAGVIGWRLGARGEDPADPSAPAVAVETSPGGATLDIGDARITSDPTTRFVITRPAGGVLVELARGKVELEVGSRGDRAPLVVRAGDTDVIVVGTRFSVDAGDGTGAVDVRVTEGVVRVVRRGAHPTTPPAPGVPDVRDVRVTAGQAWQPTHGLRPLADVVREEAATTTVVATDDEARRADGGYDTATDGDPDLLHERVAQVPVTPTRDDVRPRRDGAGSGSARPPGSATDTRVLRPQITTDDPQRALKQLILAQPLAPALDVGAVDAAALGAYYTIIREQDGEAEARAFYSIAVIQHTRLGRDGDAEKTLGDYQRRFAGTRYPTNTPALWLRTRLRCLRAIDDGCRQAAAAYVTRGGDGPARAVAERITLTD